MTPDGETWAGVADEGLFYGDGSKWTQLAMADRLPSRRISALLAQVTGARSTVWIGGEDGGVMSFQPPQ